MLKKNPGQNEIVDIKLIISEIYSKTDSLSKSGKLFITKENYVYLKISDDYINIVYPIISDLYPSLSIPNCFDEKKNIGAHISVAYPNEMKNKKFVASRNSTFEFSIEDIFDKIIANKVYYGLLVKSLDLDLLRAQNHLPKLLNFKNIPIGLHITIATSNRISVQV